MREDRPKVRSGVLFDKSKKTEHYEKRFGIIAMEKGFISADELIAAATSWGISFSIFAYLEIDK